MLPAYQRLPDENGQNGFAHEAPLFTISFAKFSTITVSLPLFSFIFCVAYSLIFFFEQSTSTHCHVWNYLPSISVSTLKIYRIHFTGSLWVVGSNWIVPATGLRLGSIHYNSLSSSLGHNLDVQQVLKATTTSATLVIIRDLFTVITNESFEEIGKNWLILRSFLTSWRTSLCWDCRFSPRWIIMVNLSYTRLDCRGLSMLAFSRNP